MSTTCAGEEALGWAEELWSWAFKHGIQPNQVNYETFLTVTQRRRLNFEGLYCLPLKGSLFGLFGLSSMFAFVCLDSVLDLEPSHRFLSSPLFVWFRLEPEPPWLADGDPIRVHG